MTYNLTIQILEKALETNHFIFDHRDVATQLLTALQREQEIIGAYEAALKARDEQEEEMSQFMNKREKTLHEALLYARGLLRETYECDFEIIEEALKINGPGVDQ